MDVETEDKQKKWFANYVNVGLIILNLVVIIGSGFFINKNSRNLQKLQAKLEKDRLLDKFARNPLVERENLQEWLVIRLQAELKGGYDNENFSSLDMKNSLIEYLKKKVGFTKLWDEERQSIIFSGCNKTELINLIKSEPWIVIKKNHNLVQNENLNVEFLEKSDSYFLEYK